MANLKPLGRKAYGSIPHLPNSRMGPGDHACHPGQARIATEKARDLHDHILVQEKLDGSCVAAALVAGQIVALSRAGYLASTSPFEQHHLWAEWVAQNEERFRAVLRDGERLVGEWLALAHGTRYRLLHEPFVAFDLMVDARRLPFVEFGERVSAGAFMLPSLIRAGNPLSVDAAMRSIGMYGAHGALDPVEGAVWRVERNRLIDRRRGGERRRVVDFVVKWVRPDKVDGCYLPEVTGQEPVWNWWPPGRMT